MRKKLEMVVWKSKERVRQWGEKRAASIFVFNLVVLLLLLLRSAGYFHPFLELNITIIFFISMIFSVLLLGSTSKTMFFLSLIFWVIAMFFAVVEIDVWSERTAIYSFMATFIGLTLLFFEETGPFVLWNRGKRIRHKFGIHA